MLPATFERVEELSYGRAGPRQSRAEQSLVTDAPELPTPCRPGEGERDTSPGPHAPPPAAPAPEGSSPEAQAAVAALLQGIEAEVLPLVSELELALLCGVKSLVLQPWLA